MSVLKINNEEYNGPFAWLFALMVLGFIFIIFFFVAALLLSPIWVPLIIGIVIGKFF